MEKVKVLFVCLGNICRSPMAEGIFQHLVDEAGLGAQFHIESAGTSGYHVGELPDARGREVCARHGIQLTSRSRQFRKQDFSEYDYILAMDRSNMGNIRSLANPAGKHRAQVHMMLDFDPENGPEEVPDPYYGGPSGFQNVYDMLLRSGSVLLERIREEKGLQ